MRGTRQLLQCLDQGFHLVTDLVTGKVLAEELLECEAAHAKLPEMQDLG